MALAQNQRPSDTNSQRATVKRIALAPKNGRPAEPSPFLQPPLPCMLSRLQQQLLPLKSLPFTMPPMLRFRRVLLTTKQQHPVIFIWLRRSGAFSSQRPAARVCSAIAPTCSRQLRRSDRQLPLSIDHRRFFGSTIASDIRYGMIEGTSGRELHGLM